MNGSISKIKGSKTNNVCAVPGGSLVKPLSFLVFLLWIVKLLWRKERITRSRRKIKKR